MSNDFVFGVDLDGVVGDFYGEIRQIAAEWLGCECEDLTEEVSNGLAEWQLERSGGYDSLHRFAVTQRDLFRRMRLVPGAASALRFLNATGVRIRIVTHRLYIPYFHSESVGQTVQWLDHHGVPYSDLCFVRDKSAVGADIYVEDSPTNVQELRAGGATVIVFANSTNRSLGPPRANNWDEVVHIVSSRLEGWRNDIYSRRAAT